jgi:hypothetical protein
MVSMYPCFGFVVVVVYGIPMYIKSVSGVCAVCNIVFALCLFLSSVCLKHVRSFSFVSGCLNINWKATLWVYLFVPFYFCLIFGG